MPPMGNMPPGYGPPANFPKPSFKPKYKRGHIIPGTCGYCNGTRKSDKPMNIAGIAGNRPCPYCVCIPCHGTGKHVLQGKRCNKPLYKKDVQKKVVIKKVKVHNGGGGGRLGGGGVGVVVHIDDCDDGISYYSGPDFDMDIEEYLENDAAYYSGDEWWGDEVINDWAADDDGGSGGEYDDRSGSGSRSRSGSGPYSGSGGGDDHGDEEGGGDYEGDEGGYNSGGGGYDDGGGGGDYDGDCGGGDY